MRVALVSVGDELLTGDTINTNAAWLGAQLHDRGVDVERVTVVPDRVADIARVVNEYRAEFDAVLVTGGIGPTHDDVTMEGVAAAFGTNLAPNQAAEEWLESEGYAAEDLVERTTYLPATAELLENPAGVAPGCVIGSVYVLPGLPDEMKGMFEQVADEFDGEPRFVETVEAAEPESALMDRIATLQSTFEVSVGSYPGEVVTLRITGGDESAVLAAGEWLRERVEEPDDA